MGRYRREYCLPSIHIDLTELDGEMFRYPDIRGPETLFQIKDHFMQEFLEN